MTTQQATVPHNRQAEIIKAVAIFTQQAAKSTNPTEEFDQKIRDHFGEGADDIYRMRFVQNHRIALGQTL